MKEINVDEKMHWMLQIALNTINSILIYNAISDYTLEFNLSDLNVLECKDKMIND